VRLRITAENRRWWVVVAMSGIMILLTLDFFGLTVALPQIGKDLDASTGSPTGSPRPTGGASPARPAPDADPRRAGRDPAAATECRPPR
jgi:hypothetical protein